MNADTKYIIKHIARFTALIILAVPIVMLMWLSLRVMGLPVTVPQCVGGTIAYSVLVWWTYGLIDMMRDKSDD